MDRKPLIGVSICAVILLVMASLTNVVGYQSVSSTTVNGSPLFQTRTQRATNQQQNIITSQYIGMGKEKLLQFPMRDNKTESFVKAFEYISKMDDKTFEWFTELCIQKAKQGDTFSDASNEIIQILRLLRRQSKTILFSFTNRNDQVNMATYYETMCPWYLGCYITIMAITIAFVIFLIISKVFFTFSLCNPTSFMC